MNNCHVQNPERIRITLYSFASWVPHEPISIREILRVLDASSRADADKLTFVQAQLAFWLLAATDGHAKNFSIFLTRGGGFQLTPLYDVLSAWPVIGNGPNLIALPRVRLAMALRSKNPHYHLAGIDTRHWRALALQSGVPGAFEAMTAMVHKVADALKQVEAQLPAGFPQRVFKPVRSGMLAHAKNFFAGLK